MRRRQCRTDTIWQLSGMTSWFKSQHATLLTSSLRNRHFDCVSSRKSIAHKRTLTSLYFFSQNYMFLSFPGLAVAANSIDPSVLDPCMECWKAVDPEISSHIDFHKRLFLVFLCSRFRWRARMKKKCYPHELMKRTAQLWVHEHSWHSNQNVSHNYGGQQN